MAAIFKVFALQSVQCNIARLARSGLSLIISHLPPWITTLNMYTFSGWNSRFSAKREQKDLRRVSNYLLFQRFPTDIKVDLRNVLRTVQWKHHFSLETSRAKGNRFELSGGSLKNLMYLLFKIGKSCQSI